MWQSQPDYLWTCCQTTTLTKAKTRSIVLQPCLCVSHHCHSDIPAIPNWVQSDNASVCFMQKQSSGFVINLPEGYCHSCTMHHKGFMSVDLIMHHNLVLFKREVTSATNEGYIYLQWLRVESVGLPWGVSSLSVLPKADCALNMNNDVALKKNSDVASFVVMSLTHDVNNTFVLTINYMQFENEK